MILGGTERSYKTVGRAWACLFRALRDPPKVCTSPLSPSRWRSASFRLTRRTLPPSGLRHSSTVRLQALRKSHPQELILRRSANQGSTYACSARTSTSCAFAAPARSRPSSSGSPCLCSASPRRTSPWASTALSAGSSNCATSREDRGRTLRTSRRHRMWRRLLSTP